MALDLNKLMVAVAARNQDTQEEVSDIEPTQEEEGDGDGEPKPVANKFGTVGQKASELLSSPEPDKGVGEILSKLMASNDFISVRFGNKEYTKPEQVRSELAKWAEEGKFADKSTSPLRNITIIDRRFDDNQPSKMMIQANEFINRAVVDENFKLQDIYEDPMIAQAQANRKNMAIAKYK